MHVTVVLGKDGIAMSGQVCDVKKAQDYLKAYFGERTILEYRKEMLKK